jgi:hypothetical protein
MEEGGTSSSGVKKEHESTYSRVKKMKRGRVKPFAVPTWAHAAKQTTKIPQMIIP